MATLGDMEIWTGIVENDDAASDLLQRIACESD